MRLAGAALPLTLSGCAVAGAEGRAKRQGSPERAQLPPPLSPGDRVALVCPGGPITPERLDKARNNITKLGYLPVPARHVLAVDGYNAGTTAQRLEDLHTAYADPSIKAVWAVRGGYGCTQLLPKLDFDLIRRNPKHLIGYSDITALLNAIHRRTGIIGVHGPVASSTFTEVAMTTTQAVLRAGGSPYTVPTLAGGLLINPGTAQGRLAGGNLSLLAAMCGTPWQVDVGGKVLLLEDVGESPYRIDRMLVQLDQAGNLATTAGIALGDFVDCEKKPDSDSLTLEATLRRRLGHLGVPVYWNFAFGHGRENAALPIGAVARLDADRGLLEVS